MMWTLIQCVCFFFMDFRGKRGDWGFVFECPICTQVLRGPLKLCQVCGSTSWVGHVIFMPKYGSFDVSQVTWAKYSMLIGRENFCCAVIGRDLLETPSLLVVFLLGSEATTFCNVADMPLRKRRSLEGSN